MAAVKLTAGAKVRITPSDPAFPSFTARVSDDGAVLYLYGHFATYWNEPEKSYDDVNGGTVQVYWRFFPPEPPEVDGHVECYEPGPPGRLLYSGTWKYL